MPVALARKHAIHQFVRQQHAFMPPYRCAITAKISKNEGNGTRKKDRPHKFSERCTTHTHTHTHTRVKDRQTRPHEHVCHFSSVGVVSGVCVCVCVCVYVYVCVSESAICAETLSLEKRHNVLWRGNDSRFYSIVKHLHKNMPHLQTHTLGVLPV